MFIFVHSLSLDLKGTTTIVWGSIDETTATSDRATADTMTTSRHVYDDDGNGRRGDGGQDKDELT